MEVLNKIADNIDRPISSLNDFSTYRISIYEMHIRV